MGDLQGVDPRTISSSISDGKTSKSRLPCPSSAGTRWIYTELAGGLIDAADRPASAAAVPQWSLFLLGSPPSDDIAWPYEWVRWRDFWVPSDRSAARVAFEEAYGRAADGARVEIVCGGGRGRTGAAMACIAQLGGVAAEDAIAWTREHYQRHAIETPCAQLSFERCVVSLRA